MSINTSFQTTYSNVALPPVPKVKNVTFLTISLTTPESMFITFMNNVFQCHLNQKNELIYLDPSEKLQKDFNGWVAKTFTSKQFTPEELNLVHIIASVWSKIKIQVENDLKTENNQEAIEKELQCQIEADSITADFNFQGCSGKVFTERQAVCLTTIANNLGK